MKKKLFCVIACLFMSIGLMRPSDTAAFECGETTVIVTTVSMEYFTGKGGEGNIAGMNEYMEYMVELYDYYCNQ